jgi:glycosyltransferase involved in cell wall biosynthesis
MPIVSIITVCLNDKIGLEKTIKSILGQDFTDYEHLVIDGASTDGTLDILDRYKDRLAYLVSEKDAGIYDAMNKGIVKAKGIFLLFLNAGDYLANPQVLNSFFHTMPQTDIVYGNLCFDYGKKGQKIFTQPDTISLGYLMKVTLLHPATFIKKDLFDQHGLYDTSYKMVADYDFFLKMFIKQNVSSSYINYTVAVFDTTGFSSLAKHKSLEIMERRKSQMVYLPKMVLDYLDSRAKLDDLIPLGLQDKISKFNIYRIATKVYFKLLHQTLRLNNLFLS